MSTYTLDNIVYTYSGTTATVSLSPSATGAITILSSFIVNSVTYTVTSISSEAFNGLGLTSVFIPMTITSIQYNAFNNNLLTTVNIPNSVTDLGQNAFSLNPITTLTIGTGVSSIGIFAFYQCGLTSLTLANTITNFGTSCFESNPNLTTVTFQNGANNVTIGQAVFKNCTNLTSLTLSNTVISLGTNMCNGCSKLISINIPASVTSISPICFVLCDLFTTFNVDVNNLNYSSDSQGILYDKLKTTLISHPHGRTNSIIPSSVTTIGYQAFFFSPVSSVTIPGSVTNIIATAFMYCFSLVNVYFLGNIPTIVNTQNFNSATDTAYYTVDVPNNINTDSTFVATQLVQFQNKVISSSQPPPVITSIFGVGTTALIYFTQSTNAGLSITNYKFSIDGGVSYNLLNPAATTSPLTITGLTVGQTYSFALIAVNGYDSNPSNIVSAHLNVVSYDSLNSANAAIFNNGASIQTATPSPMKGGYVSLSSASQQYVTIPQFSVGATSVGHSFFFKTELSNSHKILTSFSISQLNSYITIGIIGNSVYLNMNLTNGIVYSEGGGTFQSGFSTFSNLTSHTGGDIAVSVDDKIMVTHKGFNASVAQNILVSNYSGSTWDVPTPIGSMINLWNLAMTSDGKRIVATQKGGYVFVSTWNGTSYSAFVQTSDATSRTYTGLGMTADGSRIVCCTNESGTSGNVYMALWNEATNNYNAFTTIVTGISTSIGYNTMCISVDGFKIAYSSGTTGYWASWNGTAYVQQTSFTCVTALNMKFTIDANILLMTTNSAVSAIYSMSFNGTTFISLTAYGGTTALLNKNLLGLHINCSSYLYLSENGVAGGPYRNRVNWGTSYRTYRCNTITDNNWHNIYFNFYSSNYFEYWFDGNDLTGTDVLTSFDPNFVTHYANKTITTNYIGRSLNSPLTFFDGSIDDLKFYNRRLSAAEMTFLMTGKVNIPKITAGGIGPTWIPMPATPIYSSETLYTVKSNEIALTPGTNSTYAVWTSPKTTNIKVDVSFADYNSRNVGVGFQMFKINADNTFGSTIFPRTVTSTALTNAAPTNYLSVPSRSLSVSTGDKIYLRVDANGNTTAASSVISTNIYAYSGSWL